MHEFEGCLEADTWAYTESLAFCKMSAGNFGILDGETVQPGYRIYSLGMSSTSALTNFVKLPVIEGELIIAIGKSSSGKLIHSIGINPWVSAPNPDGDLWVVHQHETLLLLEWRAVLARHLHDANFQEAEEDRRLTLTVSIETCIKIMQGLVKATKNYQSAWS